MAAQTTEAKKEEYRKYLEKSGVIDQLTRVLVGLYEQPEKPANAVEFIKKFLGAPSDSDVESLRVENAQLKERTEELEKKVGELEAELEKARAKNQFYANLHTCLLYTSPSPRDLSTSRMPSSA
eukprot:TRINITY_DN1713_c0_g1_i1.p3 TRINITY_DN1713_c0_g1~~TRINITY_DN1713_c0_g1_i1.p3  ORF type:complete len:124 (-),score=51.98 TRINITY_DN1713_c0_g1_i1:10-381(-)